jgi:hypothetical protein
MDPLTVQIPGFAAVHYARATGVTLRRAEVRYAPGAPGAPGAYRIGSSDRVLVDPAREVTPDEAHALLQHDQAETGRISCTATHGERPYRGAGPITIDWPAIHAAALVVDAERHAMGCLGYDGISDAFGGAYFPPSYEDSGLAGVVRILAAAQRIRAAAWEVVHRAHRIELTGRAVAACGLRTALALDRLFRALAAVGVTSYEPRAQICGVTGYEPDDTVQVTGLGWLRGERCDAGSPTMREVSAFLAEVA